MGFDHEEGQILALRWLRPALAVARTGTEMVAWSVAQPIAQSVAQSAAQPSAKTEAATRCHSQSVGS